jgi:1-acyl-sn-glycerol-3-phosphate acyltransferase
MKAIMIPGLIRLITGAQARWVGVDPVDETGAAPQRIYFANHQSNLDAPVIWASLPRLLRGKTRPIAARDYWTAGPFRRFVSGRIMNCVLIERVKVTRANNPMLDMEQALNEGSSLILFPEGTRSMDDDGEMNEFKPGLFHLARKFPQVQLVPVFLENLNRILPKGDFLFVPLIASVTFGRPLALEPGEDKLRFLSRAKLSLIELQNREENG